MGGCRNTGQQQTTNTLHSRRRRVEKFIVYIGTAVEKSGTRFLFAVLVQVHIQFNKLRLNSLCAPQQSLLLITSRGEECNYYYYHRPYHQMRWAYPQSALSLPFSGQQNCVRIEPNTVVQCNKNNNYILILKVIFAQQFSTFYSTERLEANEFSTTTQRTQYNHPTTYVSSLLGKRENAKSIR